MSEEIQVALSYSDVVKGVSFGRKRQPGKERLQPEVSRIYFFFCVSFQFSVCWVSTFSLCTLNLNSIPSFMWLYLILPLSFNLYLQQKALAQLPKRRQEEVTAEIAPVSWIWTVSSCNWILVQHYSAQFIIVLICSRSVNGTFLFLFFF